MKSDLQTLTLKAVYVHLETCFNTSIEGELRKEIKQFVENWSEEPEKKKAPAKKRARVEEKKPRAKKPKKEVSDQETFFMHGVRFDFLLEFSQETYLNPNVIQVKKKPLPIKKSKIEYKLLNAATDISELSGSALTKAMQRKMIKATGAYKFPTNFYIRDIIIFKTNVTREEAKDVKARFDKKDPDAIRKIVEMQIGLVIKSIVLSWDSSKEEYTPYIDAEVDGRNISKDANGAFYPVDKVLVAGVARICEIANETLPYKITAANAKNHLITEEIISRKGDNVFTTLKNWLPKWFDSKYRIVKDDDVKVVQMDKEAAIKLKEEMEVCSKPTPKKPANSDTSSEESDSSDSSSDSSSEDE